MSKSKHTEAQTIGALKQMEAGRTAEVRSSSLWVPTISMDNNRFAAVRRRRFLCPQTVKSGIIDPKSNRALCGLLPPLLFASLPVYFWLAFWASSGIKFSGIEALKLQTRC